MKRIPSREEVFKLLDRLNEIPADDLESEVLEFKPWRDPQNSMKVAVEYTVCFANAHGGLIVFGIKDQTRGRENAITGCERYDLDMWRRGIYQSTDPSLIIDIEELSIPEGILLLVRVPKAPPGKACGTTNGLFKVRVGKSCMPMGTEEYQRRQVAAGTLDWSARHAEGINISDLDRTEIDRIRKLIQANKPESELASLADEDLVYALGIVKGDRVTNAGALCAGSEKALQAHFPQHEVIYLYQEIDTEIKARLNLKRPIFAILAQLTETIDARNPIRTLKQGLFHVQIPSFPGEVFREAILNSLCHRNYLETGSVYVRHRPRELVVSNPGGFPEGITPENILTAEPKQRNRLLAEIFEKVGLVDRAGTGRRRIFIPSLAFGKKPPLYEADEHTVKLIIFNGSFDERIAAFVANWQREGGDLSLEALLLLSYLRSHPEITTGAAASLLQRPEARARDALDSFCMGSKPLLERRGRKRGVAYYLSKNVAKELIGKEMYTRIKDIEPHRYRALIRSYVEDHGSITNEEARRLLGFGDSPSDQVKASRLLSSLCKDNGFLKRVGKGKATRYTLAAKKSS
jgi:ATP-dependent DNA helicase RecG